MLYFYFHSQKVYFKSEGTVLELQQAVRKQIPDVASVGIYYQSNGEELIQYAQSTPLDLVLQDDMILKLN